jgi:Flp pilus assembly protein TadG
MFSPTEARSGTRSGGMVKVRARTTPCGVSTPKAPRRRGERGASMVEFALIMPVFLLIVFGGISAALAYEHKNDVVHAVRDGARYGATVPVSQCDTTSTCGNRNWAQLVQYVTSQRSDGALSTSQICVALVYGSGTVYTRSPNVYTTGTSATFPTAGCFNDGNVDSGYRVHVSAVRGGDKINLVFSTLNITVSSKGTARYEQL